MKIKYQIQIFITTSLVCLVWGMLGVYMVLSNPNQQELMGVIAFVLMFISMAVPVHMISKKAQRDLPTA
jgi:hypothetical protein